MSRLAEFAKTGFTIFEPDAGLTQWATHVRPTARTIAQDPSHFDLWLRSAGTWFVGANLLATTPRGAVAGGPDLTGLAVEFCRKLMPAKWHDWGQGQISVCYPGYPKQDARETDGAYRYRLRRDAAHLDGLKREPSSAARFMQEFHGLILGIPLNNVPTGAAPFVVWQGSHLLVQDMLVRTLGHLDPADWPKQDVSRAYQAVRRQVFETCARVEIQVPVGQAYVAHRFSIHGMAPWRAEPGHDAERMIAYFRPYWPGDFHRWLDLGNGTMD